MRAMVVSEHGKPLTPKELPIPTVGRGDVLVRVHSCGTNFADLLLQSGRYQERPELPFSPGMEICGTVESAGENTSDDLIGTRIASYCGFGGMAEYISIPSEFLYSGPGSNAQPHRRRISDRLRNKSCCAQLRSPAEIR